MEVKAAHLGDHEFRVQADGVSMDVSLAVYSKVNLVTRVYFQIPSTKCNGTICLFSLAAVFVCVCVCVSFRILVQLMDILFPAYFSMIYA